MTKQGQKGLVSAVNVAMSVQDSRPQPKSISKEEMAERERKKKEIMQNYRGKVDYIINRLKASCKHWQLSWPKNVEDQVRHQFLDEMIKMNLDPEFKDDSPIIAALKEVEKSKSAYVPSVAEFFDIVRRHQIGNPKFPTVQHAYQEACNKGYDTPIGKWSHIAVYYAASETGWFDLRTKEEKQVFPVFKEKYQEVTQRILNGERLEPPRIMIESDKESDAPRSSKETARKHLSALRADILAEAD